jgi:hypothetical protein
MGIMSGCPTHALKFQKVTAYLMAESQCRANQNDACQGSQTGSFIVQVGTGVLSSGLSEDEMFPAHSSLSKSDTNLQHHPSS